MYIYMITVLVVIFSVLLVTVLFIRTRFWVRQPVRLCWCVGPHTGKVQGTPPLKFVDHAHVRSTVYDGVMPTDALVAYLKTQSNDVYYPNAEHIVSYFVNAYISVYAAVGEATKGEATKGEANIEGCIVSRPVELYVDGKGYRAYFHETMTSEKDEISRRLISTHSTNLATQFPNAPLVFSTTTPIMFVVPAIEYDVRWVQTKIFRKYRLPLVSYIKVTEKNVHLVVEWWKEHRYSLNITPTTAQLVSWLQSKTASIYFVAKGGEMLGSFYFKKTLMVEQNKGVVDCCCAVFPNDKSLLFQTLSTLLYRGRRANPILRVHMVSDLTTLPLLPSFKKTKLYHYFYRYDGPARTPPENCIVY